ncbi:MAG: SCO family protein [Chloroflexi bacterium]|nr:SCO family protein [Chloroflexota bacterium]
MLGSQATIRRALLLLPLLALALLGVVAVWMAAGPATGAGPATRLDTFGDAPAFALTDQLGRRVTSDQLRGKVVLANFVYTSCTETCPLLSARMQAIQDHLRRERLLGSQVQLLSFSADPAHDTPDVLRAYAARHDADPDAWRFLTGPEDEVVALFTKGFLLGVQSVPAGGASPVGGMSPVTDARHHGEAPHQHAYEVMHSNRFVLIDRQGRIRAYIDGLELEADRVVRDIRYLLRA